MKLFLMCRFGSSLVYFLACPFVVRSCKFTKVCGLMGLYFAISLNLTNENLANRKCFLFNRSYCRNSNEYCLHVYEKLTIPEEWDVNLSYMMIYNSIHRLI